MFAFYDIDYGYYNSCESELTRPFAKKINVHTSEVKPIFLLNSEWRMRYVSR